MVASNYVYTKKFTPWELPYRSWATDMLNRHSLSWGLQFICEDMLRGNLTRAGIPYLERLGITHLNSGDIVGMVQIHDLIAGNTLNSGSFLEVKSEDVQNNWNKTMRSIFEHFLGNNDNRVETLVASSGTHDISRMSQEELEQPRIVAHISSTSEEAEAYTEMLHLRDDGDLCMRALFESDERMGYGPAAFPGHH
jgi:hypothetical protein